MDLPPSTKYFEAPSTLSSQGEAILMEGDNGLLKKISDNPFLNTFSDPLCKLHLKETSEFVKSFPISNNGAESGRGFLDLSTQRRREGLASATNKRNVEAPPTPGRPIFSFSTAGSLARKTFPSKWDDAEKWLISGSSCNDSPAHHQGFRPSLEPSKLSKQHIGFTPQEGEVFAEKSRVTDEKISKAVSSLQMPVPLEHSGPPAGALSGVLASSDVLLKDKFTHELETFCPSLRCSAPTKEGFLFGNLAGNSTKDSTTEVVHGVKHRDVGTEMTPLGSSTTSRCPTPLTSSSPARHNTPANRSGPLASANASCIATIDITQLQEFHLAKLQLETKFDSVTSNWSSREEEEEDVSKSLRHFEINNECRRSVSETRTCAWEEEEKTKLCLRYQREAAKIQAWVNLQSAKAEAQSRKLEVKIQKMRATLEEKLMKRMAVVHRKAEEWKIAAQLQHSEQIQKVSEQSRKVLNRQNSHFLGRSPCGCFPCNKHNI